MLALELRHRLREKITEEQLVEEMAHQHHVEKVVMEAKVVMVDIIAKAKAMVSMEAEVAVSITGLAGPGGDDYGNPVGTVFIGYSDADETVSERFLFTGTREEIRRAAAEKALEIVLAHQAKPLASE